MDAFDLRGEILRALSASGRKVIAKNGRVQFSCTRHDDATPSAWLGDHAWGCFACDIELPLRDLASDLGVAVPARGFSLEDYADAKGFAIADLERWGCKTVTNQWGVSVVGIPYRDASGAILRWKHRHRSGTYWDGKGGRSYLYGLDVLAKQPSAPVILVEGESDCHAAWSHGVLAVGVPGAGAWKSEYAEHLRGRDLFVWQEPDAGGAAFVRKVAGDFPQAKVIEARDGEGVKDLADLHKTVGREFRQALTARMAAAYAAGQRPPVRIDAISPVVLDAIKDRKLAPVDAVPTPLPSWNQKCRDAGGGVGLARGWHVTVGANTGSGKSLVALNLAASALNAGESVGFLSLEMSQEQLVTRLLGIVSGVSMPSLEAGQSFSLSEWRTAAQALNDLYARTGGMVYVNREQVSKLEDVLAAMRFLHESHGCRYLVVDYMQLAFVQGARSILDATQQVSHSIRDLARSLGVVSVALSQFNRETSANREAPPTPQGLMGGSPLENDSDQVILLDHSEYVRNEHTNSATTRLLLAKNRHGPQAIIPVRWDYRTLRLRELVGDAVAPAPEERGEAWEPDESTRGAA